MPSAAQAPLDRPPSPWRPAWRPAARFGALGLALALSGCDFDLALAGCHDAGRCQQEPDGGTPDAHVPLQFSLGAPFELTTGEGPLAIAVGDLNQDGVDDLVVSSDTVNVFLGAGDGGFGPRADFPSGGSASAIAVGRVDGDAWLDVVVGYRVLRGLGTGALGAPVVYSTSRTTHMALARFDSDDLLDVIATDFAAADVLVGTPDGGMAFRGHAPWSRANGVAVADFDADGRLDLAVGNYNTVAAIGVFLGHGDGTVSPGQQLAPGGDWPAALVAGRFDDDAWVDLVAANYLSEDVIFMKGHGDGTFAQGAPPRILGNRANDAVAVDLDRDGHLDLAVSDNEGFLHVLLGDGHGAFSSATLSPPTRGTWAEGVAHGDFNHDGKVDLALVSAYTNTVSVYLNTSSPR